MDSSKSTPSRREKLQEYQESVRLALDAFNVIRNRGPNAKMDLIVAKYTQQIPEIYSAINHSRLSKLGCVKNIETLQSSELMTLFSNLHESLQESIKDFNRQAHSRRSKDEETNSRSEKRKNEEDEDRANHSLKKTRWHIPNIGRVQNMFDIPVDNSDEAFVPILPDKPNAQKNLKDSLKQVPWPHVESNGDKYPQPKTAHLHPYEYELEQFKPTTQFMKTPFTPKEIADARKRSKADLEPLKFITTVSELQELIEDLKKVSYFCVDLEHNNFRSFNGITCLIQISTDTQDYIIDPFKIWKHLHLLNVVTTDPSKLKIFHGGDFDIIWLQRDFGIYVVNMFDTFIAAKLLNLEKLSLAGLVQTYVGKTLDKQFQKTDWRLRPLSEDHLNYGRLDTRYLPLLYRLLKNLLLENNLLAEAMEGSRQICLKKYEKNILNSLSYQGSFKKKCAHFNRQQEYAFRELFEWRHRVAQENDESTGYVLPNHMIISLARELPFMEKEIVRVSGRHLSKLVYRNMTVIEEILYNARQMPLETYSSSLYDMCNLMNNKPNTLKKEKETPSPYVSSINQQEFEQKTSKKTSPTFEWSANHCGKVILDSWSAKMIKEDVDEKDNSGQLEMEKAFLAYSYQQLIER